MNLNHTRCLLSALIPWVLLGCLNSEPPLAPRDALHLAADRIDDILAEQSDVSSPTPPSVAPSTNAITLWYCAHPILAPALSYPEWKRDVQARQPGLAIETQYLGDWSMAVQKLTVNVAVNEPPDIAIVTRPWLAALIHGGHLAPLDEMLTPEFIADIRPAFADNLSVAGHLYALPADGFVSLLYRRAPAPVDTRMERWDELVAAAEAVKSEHPQLSPIGYMPYEELLWSADGDICTTEHSLLRQPAADEALQFLVDLRVRNLLHPSVWRGSYLAWQAWERGEVSMTVASSEHAARLDSLDAAAGPVPGKIHPVTRISDYVIVVFARDAERKRAGIAAILDYLTGAAVQGEGALAKGSLPVRTSVANTLTVPTWARALDNAHAPPLVAPLASIEYELGRSLDRAFDWAEQQ